MLENIYRGPQITATLSHHFAEGSGSWLNDCVSAGMEEARIHAGKMPGEKVAALVAACIKSGVPCLVDTNGVKPRTVLSEGMEQFTDGPEVGNWHYQIREGEKIILTGEEATVNELEEIRESLGADKTVFNLKVNLLPAAFTGKGGEILHFGDANVVCEVTDVSSRDGKTQAILLRTNRVYNQHGIYWNMGVNSPNVDLFSSAEELLNTRDLKTLRLLFKLGLFPTIITISFVSTEKQLEIVKKQLREIGWDPAKTLLMAKIETLRGVENITSIASGVGVVMARGDLADACRREGVDLNTVVKAALEKVRNLRVRVDVATDLANSLFDQWSGRSSETFGHLSEKEINELREFVTAGFVSHLWLCGETMRVGQSAPEIIAMFNEWLRWIYLEYR